MFYNITMYYYSLLHVSTLFQPLSGRNVVTWGAHTHTHDTNICTHTMQLCKHTVVCLFALPKYKQNTRSDVMAVHSFRRTEGNSMDGRMKISVYTTSKLNTLSVLILNYNCTCVYMHELHLKRTRVWSCASNNISPWRLPNIGPKHVADCNNIRGLEL